MTRVLWSVQIGELRVRCVYVGGECTVEELSGKRWVMYALTTDPMHALRVLSRRAETLKALDRARKAIE